MSGWTAVVPIKPAAVRKSRLRHHLDVRERIALTDFMLHHVLAVLARSVPVSDVAVLSAAPPEGWSGTWLADTGSGLNRELLAVARAIPYRLVVLHADLPALAPDDMDALIAATDRGVSIAPDRHGRGTNALAATRSARLDFAFGTDSFTRHCEIMPDSRVVQRLGLGFDIDTPEDVEQAGRLGHLPAMQRPDRG